MNMWATNRVPVGGAAIASDVRASSCRIDDAMECGTRRMNDVGRKVQPEDVLAYALAHPQSSTKMTSENCDLSKSHVWTFLNESGVHPYRFTPVQGLLPRDAERRYTWCNFVMNNLEDYPTFLADILWTDEACFLRNGMFNRQKVHTWSLEMCCRSSTSTTLID
ncbi:hypothetical protein AVEN_24038-1 [Araneus ventricosus]|uniref:Uncharacterized protein n=1 Tax=Araneus ventricosus TaxID=182803 RepID=A0A4Y2Q157_ARAVE|nr:hypothetical protein AVEN_2776-1 [Araneus ventricosus]GBN56066.1 hypothetical protein AVEN_24038-1 [Araneus ventricosus]